jgi:hypothetical protein
MQACNVDLSSGTSDVRMRGPSLKRCQAVQLPTKLRAGQRLIFFHVCITQIRCNVLCTQNPLKALPVIP